MIPYICPACNEPTIQKFTKSSLLWGCPQEYEHYIFRILDYNAVNIFVYYEYLCLSFNISSKECLVYPATAPFYTVLNLNIECDDILNYNTLYNKIQTLLNFQ